MKVQMRSIYAEYKVLCKYFGYEFMTAMFNNYKGYEDTRIENTYQEVYNELEQIKQNYVKL